jgi:hypothetical protein
MASEDMYYVHENCLKCDVDVAGNHTGPMRHGVHAVCGTYLRA